MPTILHIASRSAWREARETRLFAAASLASEGFIHCSAPDQVVRVADGIFREQADLVLLCIDPAAVAADIRYENCEGGDLLFPHVYGPIEIDAVKDVLPFPAKEDGTFELPAQLREHP